MVTASPALDLYSLSLRNAIAVASQPGEKAFTYVPATREAVRLARLVVREYEACCYREDLRQSAAQVKPSRSEWNEQAAWEEVSRNPHDHFVG